MERLEFVLIFKSAENVNISMVLYQQFCMLMNNFNMFEYQYKFAWFQNRQREARDAFWKIHEIIGLKNDTIKSLNLRCMFRFVFLQKS